MKTSKFKAVLFISLILSTATAVNAARSIQNTLNASAYYEYYNNVLDKALIQESNEEPEALALVETNNADAILTAKVVKADETYAKNRYALYRSAIAIHVEKYKVQQLELQLKQAQANRNKLLVQQTRLELEKARLDLLRDELHFIIDKEALRQDHLLKIKERKQQLAADRAVIDKLRLKTIKQWITYDDMGLKKSKDLIALKKQDIKADKLAIADEKKLLKAEMLAADKLVK